MSREGGDLLLLHSTKEPALQCHQGASPPTSALSPCALLFQGMAPAVDFTHMQICKKDQCTVV